MSKHKKKVSLAIPKSNTHFALDNTQNYLINKGRIQHSEPRLGLQIPSIVELNEYKSPRSLKNKIPVNILSPKSKISRSEQHVQDLLQHLIKTNEIFNELQDKETKLIKTIASMFSDGRPKKAVYTPKDEFDIKQKALDVDYQISLLTEENKRLKERLALATLEEVDERLRNERSALRMIEKHARVLPPNKIAVKVCERLTNSKDAVMMETIVQKIANEDLMDCVACLCQSISTEFQISKFSKKNKAHYM